MFDNISVLTLQKLNPIKTSLQRSGTRKSLIHSLQKVITLTSPPLTAYFIKSFGQSTESFIACLLKATKTHVKYQALANT